MKVSWDDDIPNVWKNQKKFQTTNQISLDTTIVNLVNLDMGFL